MTSSLAPSDNAADIVLALKDYCQKNKNQIDTYWDVPTGHGNYPTHQISWDYHIYDIGEAHSYTDFFTLVSSESLNNYNLPYDKLFIVSRFKYPNGSMNYLVSFCFQASDIDDHKTITVLIFQGTFKEDGWSWYLHGYSPIIVEENTPDSLNVGFVPLCAPSINMTLDEFLNSSTADRGLFAVYYLLWLYNAKTRMVSSSVPLGALAKKHNRKLSSRRSPIKAPIIITPSPSTVTILSSRPVAGSGGWTMRPHSRSGHWRTYKKTGKRIWVHSYDVHGGATGPQMYKTP